MVELPRGMLFSHKKSLVAQICEWTKTTCVLLQSGLTLCDPVDCSLPGSSVHGIFQARILRWVAISFSGGIFLTQGSNPCALQLAGFCRWILYCSATREGLHAVHLPTTHGSPRGQGLSLYQPLLYPWCQNSAWLTVQ